MQDSSRFSYISRRGLDLAPFTAETWEFFFFPETLYRTGEAFSWWDFASRHPEFAGYGIVAVVWMSLWLATLLLASFAFLARAVPRSRMRGLPTRLQGSAATALLTAVAVVIFALPSAIGVAGFTGAEGKLAWGPRLGFFLAVAASGLMGLASVLGLRVDRNLRGVCWRCFHAATGNRCEYCGVRL